ncbi:hypothetical protein K505DRAFT_341931 [Melanomma pulvis-pyrius CBS 109.77]|uniref:F-box domain-containing protein n=1 Tax=Melanomma pulvis-pyrius CBS 109.77 TaxID=1314802 RepID=A0A6A6WXF6_9PLEO|nr:hypothetical protein K505DRAFT_341931 [Melanomma pulvis-pyrius CBS 109.77]
MKQLKPRSDFLIAHDTFDISEASRTHSAGQIDGRDSISSTPSSRCTLLSNSSVLPQPFSAAAIASRPASGCDYDVPHLTQTPWERERYKKNSAWRRSKPAYVFPAHIFKRLPREVYNCIVEQLAQLHFEQDQACPCYLKDLYNLSLTSRTWDRAVTLQLYRKVWVLTDENSKMSKIKIKGTGRLKLLRRTLRERPVLGRYVRELHMSDFASLYRNASVDREEIINLVASVVMACPNLERLVGFHTPYTHCFDRLSHALSTRRNLKERVWLLAENPDPEPDEDEDDHPNNSYYNAACDPTERFLELNSSHPRLTTLILHQVPGRPSIPLNFRAIIGTFRQLPSLRHLSISGLSTSSFTNLALNSIPPYLKSIRLESLPGIKDKALRRFASSYLSTSLESVTLIDLEISSLATISNFLSPHLGHLKRFTLSQHKTPTLLSADIIPLLHSQTLNYIHWEIGSQAVPPPPYPSSTSSFPFPNSEPISCLATSLLSTSIKNNRFPSLRKIRAPHDPQGLLQALCKPLTTALLPSDISLVSSRRPTSSHEQPVNIFPPSPFPEHASDPSASRPGTPPPLQSPSLRADSPMSAVFEMSHTSDFTSHSVSRSGAATLLSPSCSRAAAEARILAARKQPFMTVRVTDPKGGVRVDSTIGGFLGRIDSKIAYEVRPDRSAVGETDGEVGRDGCGNKWIVGAADMVDQWEVVGGGGSGVSGFQKTCTRGHWVKGSEVVRVEEMF